jgi:NAD(P)-dependent dehydrogenase (short-subunit alcohol dehydrogenase family)
MPCFNSFRKKAHVILACRDLKRGEEARQKIVAATSNENVEVLQLDLASFKSIQKFVEEFKAKNIPLHVLFNNAAIFAAPFSKTEDNFESHFQVNYLGSRCQNSNLTYFQDCGYLLVCCWTN